MNRRKFVSALSASAGAGLLPTNPAHAQSSPKPAALKTLTSGTFKPGSGSGSASSPGRASHPYLRGHLKAGDIQLEMHQTIQQPHAVHEALGTHLHNEIWCVQRGVATLFINGVEHRMEAGDVGLVCAGDEHWIANAGETELAYFVVTVGPPEG